MVAGIFGWNDPKFAHTHCEYFILSQQGKPRNWATKSLQNLRTSPDSWDCHWTFTGFSRSLNLLSPSPLGVAARRLLNRFQSQGPCDIDSLRRSHNGFHRDEQEKDMKKMYINFINKAWNPAAKTVYLFCLFSLQSFGESSAGMSLCCTCFRGARQDQKHIFVTSLLNEIPHCTATLALRP